MALTFNAKLFLFFINCFLFVYSAKLNVPRILLPYKTSVSTNYTLEVSDGGCYKWSSSRPEVATITPIVDEESENECSTKAVVSAVSRSSSRQSTIILATDEGSDTVLKCDVIIDAIHSLEIDTTTRELFLDDAPEAFEVHAKNDQEDKFTSIDGLALEWKLVKKESEPNSVLRILNFESSPYEAPLSVQYWEKQGLKGHIILIEGIGTGSAGVSAQFLDSAFKNVKTATVTLVVVANLMLNPAHDVYILPNCDVHYKVELIKQGRPNEIKMPSDQYYLEVKHPDIVSLDSKRSDVTGLAHGSTTIVLNDKNTTNLEALRQPSAAIYVVSPHHIGFSVKPGNNWVLQQDNRYEIIVRLYTMDNNEIYPSKNMRIKVTFPDKYFKVEFSSENGTYHVVKTKISGKTKLTGKLDAIIKNDGSVVDVIEEVVNDQPVIINENLSLTPKQLAYPWDPVLKRSYSGNLNVIGGSGSYTWKSSDTSVIQVKKDGSFSTHGLGKATLTVYDANNKLHFDTAEILVLEVGDLEILPSPVEAMVDSQLFLPLAFYGFLDKEKKNRIRFEDCSKLKLDVEFVDRRFFVYDEETETAPYPGACRTLTFTAKYQGYSRIYVSYGKDLKTTTVIAGFKNLMPLSPPSVAVLSLGSSREVTFEGGPRPWILLEESHYTNLEIQKSSAVDSHIVRDPHRHNVDLYVYRVYCKELIETHMKFSIGNKPSATNPMPASQEIALRTSCEPPKKMVLKAITSECKSKKASCPVSQDSVKIPIQSYEDVQIEAQITDSVGRRLHNVSTLDFEWTVSDKKLGSLTSYDEIFTEVFGAKGFKKPLRHYQDFHPRGLEGTVTINVKIKGYKKELLEKSGISVPNTFKELSATMNLELVEKVAVDSEKVSVFNHPDNKAVIKVLKGSGHFIIQPSNEKLAKVSYNEETSSIDIIPKANGIMSLSIYDVCACMEAKVEVKISNIHQIKVLMPDKVELGKDIEADVTILDDDNNSLSVNLFSLIDLKAVVNSKLINVKDLDSSEHKTRFYIHGEALGHTSLKFQATSNNKLLDSMQLPVQVFPPFRLHPRNITLIKGAEFQVASSGGPEPQLNIEYGIDNDSIASVSSAGIITAKFIGDAKISGHVFSEDSMIPTIFSKDEVNVKVVKLTGIKIRIPLTRIQVDSEVPVRVVGLNEHENPFSFGTAMPELDFTWTLSDSNVASILSSFHKVAIEPVSLNNFAVRLLTKCQGEVTIKVQVKDYEGNVFVDEIQLHIFEELKIKKSNEHGLSILMTPNSETFIKTNRDGIAMMNYKMIENPESDLVSVDSISGKIKAGDTTGETTVEVVANENFGVIQRISIIVKVKPVNYVMISADTKIRLLPSTKLVTMPLGFNMKFSVGFYDNVGKKFDATSSSVEHRLSRFDLLHLSHGMENNTFHVHASMKGQSILKVWYALNPKIHDYIKIHVGEAIYSSQKSINLGDIVCFKSNMVSEDGYSGFWYTSGSTSALNILNDNGVALARDVGTTVLNYNVSSTLATSVEVVVNPIRTIKVSKESLLFISNGVHEGYNISVILNDVPSIDEDVDNECHKAIEEIGNKLRLFSPFSCEISFSDSSFGIEAREVFSVSAFYNAIKGQHQCHIKPISTMSSGLKHQLSGLMTDMEIFVRVNPAGPHQREITSRPIHVPFYPHFYVHSEDITLSNLQNFANLEIYTSKLLIDAITVSSSDSSLIHVSPPESDSKNPSLLIYRIEIRDSSLFWDTDIYKNDYFLKVKCGINNQKVQVPVKLKLHLSSAKCLPDNQKGTGWIALLQAIYDNYQNWVVTTLSVIGTIAAVFITYKAVYGQSQNAVVNNSAFLQQSGISNSSRLSHGYDSPWAHSHLPRTTPSPKPYLYSVDSTSPNKRKSPIFSPYQSSF